MSTRDRLQRWWPSTRLRHDPLADLCVEGRYAAVSIANWKLVPRMARRVLERRVAQPLTFTSDRRLTIVIPFRDRDDHLRQLMPSLVEVLRRQQVRYHVLVVEQEAPGLFNRGRLINIGIQESAARSDYYCIHDVDAVPIVANYQCPSQPLRLVTTIADAGAELQRPSHYFSGAISIGKDQVFAANGYSNEYWGWGKEDDDFFFRLLLAGFVCFFDTQGQFLDLPNPRQQQVATGRFTTPRHVRVNRARRSRLVRGLLDPFDDGLSTLTYEVTDRQDAGSHERIRVRWP